MAARPMRELRRRHVVQAEVGRNLSQRTLLDGRLPKRLPLSGAERLETAPNKIAVHHGSFRLWGSARVGREAGERSTQSLAAARDVKAVIAGHGQRPGPAHRRWGLYFQGVDGPKEDFVGRVCGILRALQDASARIEDRAEVRLVEFGQPPSWLVVEGSNSHSGFVMVYRHPDNLGPAPLSNNRMPKRIKSRMAEARQLRTGKWRIYSGPELDVARHPQTRAIAFFDSLPAARHWWNRLHPDEPPLEEAIKCARCGAHFGALASPVAYGGDYYQPQHIPQAANLYRRRWISP
jgi:hypothetical protein